MSIDNLMIIFKTTSQHLQSVIRSRKYATDDLPIELRAGDSVLIQVTYLSDRQGPPKIRYAWKHKRSYEDESGESLKLWGYRWRFIVEGRDLCRLKRPFDIRQIQVTSKDYGAAVRYVYVEAADASVIQTAQLLECW